MELVSIYEQRLRNIKRNPLFQYQVNLKQLMRLDIKATRLGELSYYSGLVLPIRKLTNASEL